MRSEIDRLLAPVLAPEGRASLSAQLGFMTLAYGISGLVFWAVSGQVLVPVLTMASQVGGPALVAVAGVAFGRAEWTRPAEDFEPLRIVTWAWLTGAILAAAALAVSHLRSI